MISLKNTSIGLEVAKKLGNTVLISHNKLSGEFRYEVIVVGEKFCTINCNQTVNIVDYFYSQKEALRFIEINHLKIDDRY